MEPIERELLIEALEHIVKVLKEDLNSVLYVQQGDYAAGPIRSVRDHENFDERMMVLSGSFS